MNVIKCKTNTLPLPRISRRGQTKEESRKERKIVKGSKDSNYAMIIHCLLNALLVTGKRQALLTVRKKNRNEILNTKISTVFLSVLSPTSFPYSFYM